MVLTSTVHADAASLPGADSVLFVLENDSGTVVKSQTLALGASTTWTTPLSDSVWYNALVFLHGGVFTVTACGSLAGRWVTAALLAQSHQWDVTAVYSLASSRYYVLIVKGAGTALETC